MTFFKKIAKSFFPLNPFEKIKNLYVKMRESLISFIHHFKILKDANISLGKYHLQNGNFKDASLRFWLINKFFAPKDPENLYWYAWSDIFLKKYSNAIDKLENNSYDKIGLKNYIDNMSTISVIPEDIEREYEAITQFFKLDKYYGEKTNLFDIFINKISQYLPKQNWDLAKGKYTVLEIDSYPFMIEDMTHNLPEPHIIDTINFSEYSAKSTRDYDSKSKIYHQISTIKKEGLASEISKKYETIIAFNSLSYSMNLKDNFSFIKNLLTDDGFFAFILPKGTTTALDVRENYYVYEEKYIRNNLELADFESISITTIVISQNYEFFVVVTK